MIVDLLARALTAAPWWRLLRRTTTTPEPWLSDTEHAWRTVAIATWAQLGDVDGQLDAVREVLHAAGHATTTDLTRDVDSAIDRERHRVEQAAADIAVAAGFDPTDAHRYDVAAVVAFVSRLRGERDGLARRTERPTELLSWHDRTAASDVHAGAVCGAYWTDYVGDGHLCTQPPGHTTGGRANHIPTTTSPEQEDRS